VRRENREERREKREGRREKGEGRREVVAEVAGGPPSFR